MNTRILLDAARRISRYPDDFDQSARAGRANHPLQPDEPGDVAVQIVRAWIENDVLGYHEHANDAATAIHPLAKRILEIEQHEAAMLFHERWPVSWFEAAGVAVDPAAVASGCRADEVLMTPKAKPTATQAATILETMARLGRVDIAGEKEA